MHSSRLSIARVMGLTALLALDFACLRYLFEGYGTFLRIAKALDLANGFMLEYGLLGMLNVLIVTGVFRLRSDDPERRAYYRGFLAGGLVAMVLYYAACVSWGARILGEPRALNPFGLTHVSETIGEGLQSLGVSPKTTIGRFCYRATHATSRVAILTAPQLIVAHLAGLAARGMARRRTADARV